MSLSSMSWLPKLGGIVAAIGAALLVGAAAGGPHALLWIGPMLASLGASVVGLSARQDNRSSEQVGAGNVPPKGSP